MVLKVISLFLILAVVCSQVFAAPLEAESDPNETWGEYMNRITELERSAVLNKIAAEGATTPSDDAVRGPKPGPGQAADLGNSWWGWGMPWGGWGWGWGMYG